MLAFPGEELPSLVAISFLEIAGRGAIGAAIEYSANSLKISGVGRGVSQCGQ